MLDSLLLLSGNDIPFPTARLSVHQPTLKEIGYIGEESFFIGCETLLFKKEKLLSEDKDRLQNISNFDIIMSIINGNDSNAKLHYYHTLLLLSLLFPQYAIDITENEILLVLKVVDNYEGLSDDDLHFHIDNKNFDDFQSIISTIFCLGSNDENSYNPQSELAKEIADKLKKGQDIRAKNNNQSGAIAIFSRYMSILAVGLQKNLYQLNNYTVYQLNDEFKRFELKVNYDLYVQAKMAGAKDVKEVDHWMMDIHSDSTDKK